MKVILTAGHELSGFEQVHQLLTSAGVAQAQMSKRDSLSINALQQNILTALDVDVATDCVQLSPGKIWQDLAVDIFLGNLEQKIWGFADTRTLWLLDFWKGVDTQTYFVLVYSSPAQAIASVLAHDASPQAIGAILHKWKSDNTELLRFYHRNKDRALLVHVNSISNPTTDPNGESKAIAFVQASNQAFGINLKVSETQKVLQQQATELANLMAEQALLQHVDFLDCYQELESVADLPSHADYSRSVVLEKAFAEFAELKTASVNGIQLQIELKTAQESYKAIEQVVADIQQKNSHLSVELATITTEKDLLTLQLHKVQEEIENIFLSRKSVEQEYAQLKQAHSSLEKTDIQKAQEIKQLREKIANLEKTISSYSVFKAAQEKLSVTNKTLTEKIAHLEKTVSSNAEIKTAQDKLVATNKTLTEENNLLLLQLHQVQEELENYYLKYKTLAEGSIPQKSTTDSFIASFWKRYQPDQINIDLRSEFSGDNWYDPEANGTWAGPGLKSTLKIPALANGEYALSLVITDAMDPDIISTMTLSLNGTPLALKIIQLDYPANVTAHIDTNLLPRDSLWQFEFAFANNVSPADSDPNNNDHRFLAVKLQQLFISSTTIAAISPAIKSITAPAVTDAEPVLSLNQFTIKMNEPITGNNWHDPEEDGRWAGPETLSTVIMPGLVQGQYDINLQIVDAIESDVLAGMEMLINGFPIPLSFDWSQFPTPITARFSSEQLKPQAQWEIGFRFPKTVAPSEQNPASPDHRKLAVRVESIAFTPV